MPTPIQWTDETWNPIRGCSRVSPGCENCYAERIAARFSGSTFKGFARRAPNGEARWTGKVALVPEKLDQPLRWRQPRRIFVNSMSDLFHEDLADEDIAQVFVAMALAPQHTFQVLTKRAARMRLWCSDRDRRVTIIKAPRADWVATAPLDAMPWPLPNVWLGVSCENQQTADARIPLLLQTPAAVRFLSCEPVLESIDLRAHLAGHCPAHDFEGGFCLQRDHPGVQHLGWVIVGGESGPGARPCDLAWARSIVAQCRDADVSVFVKQLGTRPHDLSLGRWQHHAMEGGEERFYIQGRHVATVWANGTWHTWDARGVGGENDIASDIATARRAAETAVARQGWHALKLRDRKGSDPEEWPDDLGIRDFPEAPHA